MFHSRSKNLFDTPFYFNICQIWFRTNDKLIFLPRNGLVVRAGRNNPRHIRSIERKIKGHIYHPKYDQRTFYYDVALVFLDKVSRMKKRRVNNYYLWTIIL